MGTVYELTNLEIAFITKWARERNDRKKVPGSTWKREPRKSVIQTNRKNHYVGCRAEYVVEKLTGGKANYEIYEYHGDRGAPDIPLPDGRTAEVKGRTEDWHEFALDSADLSTFTADVGILVVPGENDDILHPDYQVVEVVGFISREEFIQHHKVKNLIKKPGEDRAIVAREFMHPLDNLYDTWYEGYRIRLRFRKGWFQILVQGKDEKWSLKPKRDYNDAMQVAREHIDSLA